MIERKLLPINQVMRAFNIDSSEYSHDDDCPCFADSLEHTQDYSNCECKVRFLNYPEGY